MQQDQELLLQGVGEANSGAWPSDAEGSGSLPLELAVITYFQRLTGLLISVVSQVIEREDQPEFQGTGFAQQGMSDENTNAASDSEDDPGNNSDQQPLLSSEHNDQASDAFVDDDDEPVEITSEDITRMGLDPWSPSDRLFIENIVDLWWNRKAKIRRSSIECCGIRIR